MENTQVSKSHKFYWNLNPIKPSIPNSFHMLCNEKFLSMVVAWFWISKSGTPPTSWFLRSHWALGHENAQAFIKIRLKKKVFGSLVHFNNPSLCQTPHPCPLVYEPLLKSVLFLSILHGRHQVVPRISLHSLVPMQYRYIYCWSTPYF